MSNKPTPRRTSRIDPDNPPVRPPLNDEVNEAARREFVRQRTWQSRLMYLTWITSALAIALYFAHQVVLAQIAVVLATLALLGLCWMSFQRYKYNRERREEILARLDLIQDDELRQVFNEARNQRGLPPDEKDTTGYTAMVARERARIAAKTGRPNRVDRLQSKDQGVNNGGKRL